MAPFCTDCKQFYKWNNLTQTWLCSKCNQVEQSICKREDIIENIAERPLVRSVNAIIAYVALSQGRLYNPRLSEMLDELLREVSKT
jgi:hypothetical protein